MMEAFHTMYNRPWSNWLSVVNHAIKDIPFLYLYQITNNWFLLKWSMKLPNLIESEPITRAVKRSYVHNANMNSGHARTKSPVNVMPLVVQHQLLRKVTSTTPMVLQVPAASLRQLAIGTPAQQQINHVPIYSNRRFYPDLNSNVSDDLYEVKPTIYAALNRVRLYLTKVFKNYSCLQSSRYILIKISDK